MRFLALACSIVILISVLRCWNLALAGFRSGPCMEDQAHYMGFVAEGLQHSMLEYTTGGRFFASIVLHEGGKMVKLVSRLRSPAHVQHRLSTPREPLPRVCRPGAGLARGAL